jgi:hypothetical protein
VLGGHRAVGLMATHDNSIAFTIDTIDDTFALTAFTPIGAGMLSFPITALERRPSRRVWPGYTIIVGFVMLVSAASYAADNHKFSDLMLFISGAAVLALWLAGTDRSRASCCDVPLTPLASSTSSRNRAERL